MGASHQLARSLIDDAAIGQVTSGTAVVMSAGMEDWHPNPDFFFQKGGGPILDLGPYYISNLVQLLGPVQQVTSMTGSASDTRTIGNGPREGETVQVETPTTIHAVLKFHSGAIITLLSSWDVVSSTHPIMELYGTNGTMGLPDPNFFGGDVVVTLRDNVSNTKTWDHPFGVVNDEGEMANYRGAGLADMALAIAQGRPHRCDDAFATHVIDVLTAILEAGETGQVISISTSCARPLPLDPQQAQALLAHA
jgi:predicted dehydrogenase